MAWQTPQFSRKDVNKAGAVLIDPNVDDLSRSEALTIVNNWRASHYFPLNAIQNGLRQKAVKVNERSLVAQRIKRLPSILQKLRDIETMKLAEIQDIGGCRAVVESMPQVRRLVFLHKMSKHKHVLVKENDYISNPKETGYRSFHLVYKYRSPSGAYEVYDGLKIEIQLRTKLQHSWATAVETVGAFSRQALKASRGADDWLRFFVC